jgi:hypothetical protein
MSATKEFEGIVAIDGEGYVVWYYHLYAAESWDFLPDHQIVIQVGRMGVSRQPSSHSRVC